MRFIPARLRQVVARVALLTLAVSAPTRAEAPFSFETTPGQLPKSVVPRNYTARLEPDLNGKTTRGSVRIELEVRTPVNAIVLNAFELEIDRATLTPQGGAPLPLTPQLNAERRLLTLPLEQPLPAGTHLVELAFRGRINAQAQGFFFDRYPTPSGDKLMFGTQMEPIDARRVLPCFDEPAFRATFDVTLVVPENFLAVSNMPAVREARLGDGRKEVTFARTPPMPTYLLALFGGEFETLEDEHDGIHLRIITTEGKRETARYALEVTKRVLQYYHEYFGTPYPLPKLDQVAVPNAFSTFGAMENWGCISYIDTALLFDPATSSQHSREEVFKYIAHEVAHQWFGNLVTMAWWDNLWLNESFASWMETKCTDLLNPEWRVWLRAHEDKERAMSLDARKSTHPVLQPIDDEAKAEDAFDLISYQKGQAFLRMLEAYLGEDAFRAGIRRYMTENRLSNTTSENLWAALEAASRQPVRSIAAQWTEQPGYPIVTQRIVEDRLVLDQVRFVLNDPTAKPLKWRIPVTYARTDALQGTIAVHLLEPSGAELPLPKGSGPVKLNVGETGYYRVLYDDVTFGSLVAQLPGLPEADQLNLLGDTWALVQAGRMTAPAYLELVVALRESRSLPVWSEMLTVLREIDLLQREQAGRRAFQAWAVSLLRPQLARLGWEPRPGESPLDGTLRAQIVNSLGRWGDAEVIARCQALFGEIVAGNASVPPDLRDPVFQTVGRYADQATYERLHTLARTAQMTQEKRRAYGAMQAALDPTLAKRTLALTLGDELSISENNRNIARVAMNGEHADLAWRFTLEHLDPLLAKMTTFGVNQYLPQIAAAFTDAARADELEAVTTKHLPPEALAEAQKTSELIRIRSLVKARELPLIDAWIARQRPLPES
jgi:aminopeptidase N